MSNNDQQLVDHLFQQIFVQKLRCTHFNTVQPSPSVNSVWNKSSDETKILDMAVNNYKKYYQDKADALKTYIEEKKGYDVSSYFTYDTKYYIKEYDDRVNEVNEYIVVLDNKTVDQIATDDLSLVSEKVNALYPDFMAKPTLLGLL